MRKFTIGNRVRIKETAKCTAGIAIMKKMLGEKGMVIDVAGNSIQVLTAVGGNSAFWWFDKDLQLIQDN